ncbi:MAG: ATPase, T2SS/T4P/T4SS family [Methylovulum sp.]|nr:ATPase, T2SS/T4P/T4SS family [Methylovulum sp.]
MKKLGQHLIENNIISQQELEAGLAFQQQFGGRLGEALIKQGICSEEDILPIVAGQWQLPRLGDWLKHQPLPAGVEDIPLLGFDAAWWYAQNACPLGIMDACLWIVMDDVFNSFVVDSVHKKNAQTVRPVLATNHELRQLLVLLEGASDYLAGYHADALQDMAIGAPVVQFVNDTIQRALDARASDIHFETYRGIFRVRFRVDGVLHEVDRPGIGMQAAVISRLKLMAGLDISEKRLPQDGRIRTRLSGISLDIRVATTPCVMGEDIVMRLLISEDKISSLADLNMHADHNALVESLLRQTNGIILVTGPTGSGKSTTLYAFLQHLFSEERKIITVEDPVEYQVSGITQIQVNAEIGLNFASVLRSVLRQDPDIVLIGEIRDKETAEIAIQAALTGHLVLSTLHTNDAPGAYVRLMDMGIQPYLLASSIIGVLGQRLVRKICPRCATADATAGQQAETMGWQQLAADQDKIHFMRGQGCPHCLGSGYRGRRPIFEMFAATDDVHHQLTKNPDELKAELIKNGMRTLQQDGILHAMNAETTIEEVMRVVG